ncbi:hypothetical protein AMJ82_05710 [candidate division TA06 bacterium SM23_40]|uniref:Peptidase M41 domain-containing protein n=1 Tax=candidate division TA06 bacterium SM23_40 TaxID=1703774 RepID=A0A0S8GBC4_UNCT6|nr:MAG: hypothetical protein AMJ82_05710 [candidate division TA06 bacterium SM23_40]
MKRKKKLEIAYHEAGHAVACYRLRVAFNYVTVEPTEDAWGHIMHPCNYLGKVSEYDDDRRGRWKIEKNILVLLAGGAAEALVSGREDWNESGSSDYEVALALSELIEPTCTDVHGKYLDYMIARARAFVRRRVVHCPIEHLALELMERRRIGSRTARRIIRRSLENDSLTEWLKKREGRL